mgnify:CR=1 FL=1
MKNKKDKIDYHKQVCIYAFTKEELNKFYDFAVFTLSSPDKTFEFTQGQPALVWTIQHNLNKFPSVSVVDTSNTVVNSQVNYVDKNNITINNTAQFAGKAYLN